VITAEGLKKTFSKHTALDDINLKISKGERVVFIGRNGSGKTTFIRCILGLYNYEGTLSVDGMNPRRNRIGVLQRVGYVPQASPYMNIKVADLMRYAADISGRPVDPIIETAKTLKLDNDDFKKNYLKLSGGMKQKLLIAIALGRGNDIIIMDEPTSNLDPDSRKIFYDLFLNCSKDMNIILTSHRSDELGFLVNRVVEMDYGKIIRESVAGSGERTTV
jgi:ABC-2 type transport system ATP-binding protein